MEIPADRYDEEHDRTRKRVSRQLADVMPERSLRRISSTVLWPGGLNQPQAYLSATKQTVAQSHRWPLETLKLTLQVAEEEVT